MEQSQHAVAADPGMEQLRLKTLETDHIMTKPMPKGVLKKSGHAPAAAEAPAQQGRYFRFANEDGEPLERSRSAPKRDETETEEYAEEWALKLLKEPYSKNRHDLLEDACLFDEKLYEDVASSKKSFDTLFDIPPSVPKVIPNDLPDVTLIKKVDVEEVIFKPNTFKRINPDFNPSENTSINLNIPVIENEHQRVCATTAVKDNEIIYLLSVRSALQLYLDTAVDTLKKNKTGATGLTRGEQAEEAGLKVNKKATSNSINILRRFFKDSDNELKTFTGESLFYLSVLENDRRLRGNKK
jgi:hypothetical protein